MNTNDNSPTTVIVNNDSETNINGETNIDQINLENCIRSLYRYDPNVGSVFSLKTNKKMSMKIKGKPVVHFMFKDKLKQLSLAKVAYFLHNGVLLSDKYSVIFADGNTDNLLINNISFSNNRNIFKKILQFKTKRNNSASKYKGVQFLKGSKFGFVWRARINLGGKKIDLGIFDNEIDAAKKYDEHSFNYYGENAILNFPKEVSQ